MKRTRLNDRQLAVLAWLGQGCPPRDWPDYSYRTSALALQARGLATVNRRRGAWSATITETGRRVLEAGGTLPPEDRPAHRSPGGRQGTAMRPAPKSPAIENLIQQVQDAGGTLRVSDPDATVRAAFRRAISLALTSGAVPDGFALKHTGRDRGDLVIRLIPLRDLPTARPRPEPIPVPDDMREVGATVRNLVRDHRPAISDAALPRAARILEGVSRECARRGYVFGPPVGDSGHFRISIGEDAAAFAMSEEDATVETYPDEEVASKKYPWQRVSLTKVTVASGRLSIRALGAAYPPVSWADRKRWSLEDKLLDLFTYVEGEAAAARANRDRAARERRERRLLWERAVPQARRRFLEHLNAERASQQAASWQEAKKLREYAAAVRNVASQAEHRPLTRRLSAWAGWVEREAAQIDPLTQLEAVGFEVPEAITPYDMDKYMPRGMTVRHPPGDEPGGWD
ncbi:hypothetical protein [Georgenia ruanii]|uniref:hypothetical protein n=1 Tax=Georgenia ruanii TaxID=348442 RepID=UPI0012653705|nr:hypothetical protein [Georgenia ruanii]